MAWRWTARAMFISPTPAIKAIKEWVAASNTVTTLVSSGLAYPSGVAVDGAGNVYIADTFHNAIKEWVAASNTVITLVSSGFDLTLWRGGGWRGQCLHRRHWYNNAIKEWMAASNTVTTLVSRDCLCPLAWRWTARAMFTSLTPQQRDQGMDGGQQHRHHAGVFGIESTPWRGGGRRGQCLYRRHGNNAIKKWMAASNTVTTLVASGLNYPCGVAVDGAGNVYIADTDNNAIKELPHAFVDTTAKTETAAAGSDALPVVLPATANLTGPFAPASDSPWLTITGVTNGVVSFAFTANPSATSRTANITLLGRPFPSHKAQRQSTPPHRVHNLEQRCLPVWFQQQSKTRPSRYGPPPI